MPRPAKKSFQVRFVLRPTFLPADNPKLPPPSLDLPNTDIDEVWIEGEVDDDWMAAYRITPQDGVPVIAELRVFPREVEDVRAPRAPGRWAGSALGVHAPAPPGGLTATVLRQLRVGDTSGSQLHAGLAQWRQIVGLSIPAHLKTAKAGFRSLQRGRRSGKKGYEAETLLSAAVFYVEHGGRHPVKALAEAWKLTPPQARDLLQAAKEKGYLTAGRLGVASRTLTEKARHLLAAKETTRDRRDLRSKVH